MYTTSTHDTDLSRKVLERIGQSWDRRVAVRNERLDLSAYYDATIPDYPVTLVPFWSDPDFAAVDDAVRLRMLAAAWVVYNEKAIYLEDEIVQPLCTQLLRGRLPGASDALVKQVIAQIQVDEQFHILMCLDICHNARERHTLQDFVAPEPRVGTLLKARLAALPSTPEGERAALVVRLVYASVAEMSINAYLNQVAGDETIQPLNRINTDLHRRDESAHSTAFREIVASVYRALDDTGQATFRRALTDALDDFTAPDLLGWEAILAYLGIERRDAMLERAAQRAAGKRLNRDYSVLSSLCEAIGIAEEFGPLLV